MSQQIRVLQCINCEKFQADIVKQANKWKCKVCNFQQKTGKEVMRGTGTECRMAVQRLNMEKHQKEERQAADILNQLCGGPANQLDTSELPSTQTEEFAFNEETEAKSHLNSSIAESTQVSSKWAAFLDAPELSESAVTMNELNTSAGSMIKKPILNYGSKKRWTQSAQQQCNAKNTHIEPLITSRSKWDAFINTQTESKVAKEALTKEVNIFDATLENKTHSKWDRFLDTPTQKVDNFNENEPISFIKSDCKRKNVPVKRKLSPVTNKIKKPSSKWDKYL